MIKGIKDIYSGGTKINKAYLGTSLVFERLRKYERYSKLQTNPKYSERRTSSDKHEFVTLTKNYDNYTFNSDNGTFTMIGENPVFYSGNKYIKKSDNQIIYGSALNPGDSTSAITFRYETIIESVKNEPIYGKGTYVDTIEAKLGTYPDNGIDGDYWYVRID